MVELGTGDPRSEWEMSMARATVTYNELGFKMESDGSVEMALGAARSASLTFSLIRRTRAMTNTLHMLGLTNDDTIKALAMMGAGAQMGRAAFGITRALIRLAQTKKVAESLAAAAETTAQAVAQNWVGIAIAAGAAATVAAAFKTGEYFGEMSRRHEVRTVMTQARGDALA